MTGVAGMLLCGLVHPVLTDAATGIEQEMSFEGKIVTSTGQNIPDGTYNMEFRIYTGCTNEPTSSTGCTAVWTEDYLNNNSQGITFTSGTYQVNLGSICGFTTSTCRNNANTAVNWNSYPLYLSLQIGNTSNCSVNNPGSSLFTTDCGGDGVMNPFILLSSTPYSFNSNQLGGLTASQFGQIAANNTWTGSNILQDTSTAAFQVKNGTGNTILSVDTSNSNVLLGNGAANTAGETVTIASGNGPYGLLDTDGTTSMGFGVDDTAGGFVGTHSISSLGFFTAGNSNNAMTIGTNGSVHLRDYTDSTSAFLIQNSTGGVILSVDSTAGQVTIGNGASGLSTASSSSVQEWDAAGSPGSTVPVSPHTVGNLMLLAVKMYGTSLSVNTVTGGGVGTWHFVTGFSSTANNDRTEIWQGTVTSTGSSTVTVAYNGTTTGVFTELAAQEFTAGLGSGTTWTITSSNTNNNSSSSNVPFPSLTPSQSNELYWGYESVANSGNTTCSPAGFTCTNTTGATNIIAYSTSLTSGTAYAPVGQQPTAGTSSGSAVVAVASASSGSNALTVDGGAVIGEVNSTTALQIQDGSSNVLFNADTSGKTITISGTTSTFGSLTIANSHFKSTQTTTPTIGAPASCGTTPSSAVTSGSTDSAGSFYITEGTGTAGACTTVITFNQAYGAAPKSIILSPDYTLSGTLPDSSTSVLGYVSVKSATTFTVKLTGGFAAGTRYGFDYWVIE